MMPVFHPQQIVIVSPALPVRTGDEVFVALRDGERVVKIAHASEGGWMLQSANPFYPPRYVFKARIQKMFAVAVSLRREL